MLQLGQRESGPPLREHLELETTLGLVRIDRDRAPDHLVHAWLKCRNAHHEHSSVARVEVLVMTIDFLTSFVEYLKFAERYFELFGKPQPYLTRRAAHFAAYRWIRAIQKGVRFDGRRKR
jgi:hypothetical protein